MKLPFYLSQLRTYSFLRSLKKLFCLLLFFILTSSSLVAQYTTKNVVGAWENSANWSIRPIPTDDPDDGILSSSSYQINGTITRTGSITQGVDVTINAGSTLEVSGDYVLSGGHLTLNGTLIVRGNLSSSSDIVLAGSAKLIVYGDVTMTGGKVDTNGDVIVGGNFLTSTNTIINNAGNFAVAGDYTDTNGNLHFSGTPSNKESFYALGVLNTPNWTAEPCVVSGATKTCNYGNLTDLITNDYSLYLILLNMGKISPCSAITITTQPATQSKCVGDTVTFSVEATNATLYQWRKDGSNIIGANLASYTIPIASAGNVGSYDVIASNATCPKLSDAAVLTLNPAPLVSIATTSALDCYGALVDFEATPVNGGVSPVYNWLVQGNSVSSSTLNHFSYKVTANDAVQCVMTSSACSSPAFSNMLSKTVKSLEVNIAPVSPTTFCAGSSFNATITVPCSFATPNTFSVQLSDATGDFTSFVIVGTLVANVAGTYIIPCIIPITTPTGTNYQIKVVSSYATLLEGQSVPSNPFTVNEVIGTAISPNMYGNNVWNVFCYKGNSTTLSDNTYMGYYTENNLPFNSRTRWLSGTSPATANGSTGLAYQGCTSLPATNIALSFMRTNIPCGYYQISIPYAANSYELYIDGAKITTFPWIGWIYASTQVEFRLFHATGASGLQVAFALTNSLVVSPTVYICSGTNTTLTASGGGAGVAYSWSPNTALSSTIGALVVANPTANTTYTVKATDPTEQCFSARTVLVRVAATINLNVTASPTTTVCGGVTSTTLTATGANTYTWSPATGLSSTTGASVLASPTSVVEYTVTGSIGACTAPVSKKITITGIDPSGGGYIDPNAFGDGTWNALCYSATNFLNYYGYYTEDNLSFNTESRWAQTARPSVANAASGLAYSGCVLPAATYSVRFKRTNVPCGYYSLTVNASDDAYSFLINSVQVASGGASSSVRADVWRGFIGPSSELELRLANTTVAAGKLDFSLNLSNPNTLSAPVTICANTSATLSSTEIRSSNAIVAGATYVWRAEDAGDEPWLGTATARTRAVKPPLATPDGTHNFICRITDAANTGCWVDQTLPLTVNATSNTIVTPTSATVYCPSSNFRLTASGANTYSWTSLPTGFTATGAVATVNPAVTTTYTVKGYNNCNYKNAEATVTVVPLTDPAVFPSGKWNAYVYRSTAIAAPVNYTGFIEVNDAVADDYSFNTTANWSNAIGPSNAVGYGGCSIGSTNYTVCLKRTDFKCDYYKIDVPSVDDIFKLFIDGVEQTISTTTSWTGYLTASSTVEFRYTNNAGPGNMSVTFTRVIPPVTITPLVTNICAGSLVGIDITASAPGVGNSYFWTPTTDLSAPLSATTNANPNVTTVYTVTVKNCSGTTMATKLVTVGVLSPSVILSEPLPQSICEYTNTTFSITSSNLIGFVWQLSSDGTNWDDMTDGGVYAGALTKDLALTAVPFALNGMKYRCKTTVCSSVFSNDALLTVKKAPTITLGSYYMACLGASNFSIPFATTGSPTLYSLGSFGTATAITDAALGTTPLLISIPALTLEGDYSPILKVKDVLGCESLPVSLSLKLRKISPMAIYKRANK